MTFHAAATPFFLLAQAQPDAGSAIGSVLFPFMMVGLIFFFLVWRPQMQQQKKHSEFLSKLSVGDEVVTTGGILGKVSAVDENVVTLEVGKSGKNATKFRILRKEVRGGQAGLFDKSEPEKEK